MTTPVCVRRRIRQLDRQGLSHREISRKLGVSRTTVVKYANHGDCSPKPLGSGHAGRSLVDAGYSAVVDGWPAADLRMPVKQRHTATRVYCLCSISCCGFSHDDFSGLGRACRPRNGLNWMVLVSPPERTGKDYDQHAPSTVYPSFAAERGIRRVDRAENTCQRADGA